MKKYFVSIVISSFFIALSGFLLIVLVPNTVKLYADGDEYFDDEDMVTRIERCDREYYDKEYGELYYWLVLDDCKEEEFDVYWEVINGYQDYCQYRQWANCDDTRLTGSSNKAEEFRQKVINNVNNVEFSLNQRRFEEFVEKVK